MILCNVAWLLLLPVFNHYAIYIFVINFFPEAKSWLSKIYKITNSLPSDKGFQYCQEMGTLISCEDDLDCASLL